MKRMYYVWPLAILALGLLLTACSKKEEAKRDMAQAEKKKIEAEAEWQKARADYIAQVRKERADIGQQIDLWEARIDTAPADQKADYQARIKELKKQRDGLDKQIASAEKADTQEKWDKAKVDIQAAWDKLKTTFNDDKAVIHIRIE